MRVASIIPCLNETDYLGAVLHTLKTAGVYKNLVVINKSGFHGTGHERGRTGKLAREYGADVFEDYYGDEAQTRNNFLQVLQKDGYDYVLIVDADEVHNPDRLKSMLADIAAKPEIQYPAFRCGMYTYFRYPSYRIDPPEPLKPIFLVRSDIRFTHVREIGRHIEQATLTDYRFHHFSYARSEDKIKEKLANFMHKDELVEGWFEEKFINWSPEMLDFHPTHPAAYHSLVYEPVSVELQKILHDHGSKWVKDHLLMRF